MKYGGDEKKRGAFLLGNGHSDQNLGIWDGGQGGGGTEGYPVANTRPFSYARKNHCSVIVNSF